MAKCCTGFPFCNCQGTYWIRISWDENIKEAMRSFLPKPTAEIRIDAGDMIRDMTMDDFMKLIFDDSRKEKKSDNDFSSWYNPDVD